MNDPVIDAARAAARILDTDLGPGLPADVERAVIALRNGGKPVQYPDYLSLITATTSIGSLILAVASIASNMRNARRNRAQKASAAEIEQHILEGIGESANPASVNTPTADKVVRVVIEQVIRITSDVAESR